MPIYEYRCSDGHEYEKVEGFDAPVEHACPHCGETARRQFSAPAVIFKGSGFYSTDNRKGSSGGNGGSKAKVSEEHTPSQESGGDVKAEAKAEAKSEAKATD